MLLLRENSMTRRCGHRRTALMVIRVRLSRCSIFVSQAYTRRLRPVPAGFLCNAHFERWAGAHFCGNRENAVLLSSSVRKEARNCLMSSNNLYGDASQFEPSAGRPAARYDLRPLSTGEVLDRTFQLYRSRFALFAGLALLPAAVSTVTNVARLVIVGYPGSRTSKTYVWAVMISVVLAFVAALASIVLYGITQAATTWAVSRIYLGEAASIKTAYKVGFQHWFRYTLVVLRQMWSAMWLPFALIMAAAAVAGIFARHRFYGFTALVIVLFVLAFLSLIYGVWAFLRVSLAVPAAVVESLKVGAAMRRSAALLASRKVRVFLLLLLLFALYMVVGTLESPLLILAVRSRGTEAFVTLVIQLGINFAAATLIGPVGAIGLCLFYFDERVRREGFDIEWMMGKLAAADASAPDLPGPAPEAPAEPA